MRRLLLILVLLMSHRWACGQQRPWVERIVYDSLRDGNFDLGSDTIIYQYHNDGKGVLYRGDQVALHQALRTALTDVRLDSSFNGMVRFRFVVNKQGQSGMFRWLVCNAQGEEVALDPDSLEALERAVQQADGWQVKSINGTPVHYYQYVLFRLHHGAITQILP